MNDMSVQGKNSCKNGSRGEEVIRKILDDARLSYSEQHATGFGTIIDFIVGIWAVEVKYHSGQPGTIWQKYHRTIYSMRHWPGNRVLVVAGHRHSGNIMTELEDFGAIFGVKVIDDSQLLEVIS